MNAQHKVIAGIKMEKYYIKNRIKKLEYAKQYRLNNKDKIEKWKLKNRKHILKYKKEYYLKNKDKIKEYLLKNKERISKKTKEYALKNKERRRKYFKQYQINNRNKIQSNFNKRIKENPKLRISRVFSKGIWYSLKGNKNKLHWETLVNYTLEDLKLHLEKQFTKRMSWNNHGRYWHIDHRIPISYFKFSSYEDEEFKECWALENLQPLEVFKNLRKGSFYSEPTLKQVLK